MTTGRLAGRAALISGAAGAMRRSPQVAPSARTALTAVSISSHACTPASGSGGRSSPTVSQALRPTRKTSRADRRSGIGGRAGPGTSVRSSHFRKPSRRRERERPPRPACTVSDRATLSGVPEARPGAQTDRPAPLRSLHRATQLEDAIPRRAREGQAEHPPRRALRRASRGRQATGCTALGETLSRRDRRRYGLRHALRDR